MSEPASAERLGDLLTEQINPASVDFDALPTVEMLAVINREDSRVALAVEQALPRIAAAVDAITAALQNGGRLFYIGAGTSGRLGVLDASECAPTFNVPPDLVTGIMAGGDAALRRATEVSEDSPDLGRADLLASGFSTADVLVGIAASGRTPYVIGALDEANRMGAATACIVCAPHSELAARARFPIEVLVGPEVITGSTRMKAGTATKLVLNMLTSGTMVKLGFVYSNLMVNVQPRNHKLVDRAERIIIAVTGCQRAEASRLLTGAGMQVRLAIVMGKLGLSRDAASERLTSAQGSLRRALSPIG